MVGNPKYSFCIIEYFQTHNKIISTFFIRRSTCKGTFQGSWTRARVARLLFRFGVIRVFGDRWLRNLFHASIGILFVVVPIHVSKNRQFKN